MLGNDQPVWAFQARGLDGLREPHTTIEAMAADYLGELRKVRPHGPYFLGALCAGALIAAEMARSLREAGETVLPLLLLDPPSHALQGGYLQMTEERFVNKMKTRAAMGGIAAPVDDPGYMKAVVRTVTAFEHAIARHRPRPYDGSRLHAREPPAPRRGGLHVPEEHLHGQGRAIRSRDVAQAGAGPDERGFRRAPRALPRPHSRRRGREPSSSNREAHLAER